MGGFEYYNLHTHSLSTLSTLSALLVCSALASATRTLLRLFGFESLCLTLGHARVAF